MTTTTKVKRNYYNLFEKDFRIHASDFYPKLRPLPKSSMDIALYISDWFSSQFKDKHIFNLNKIKEVCAYSENTIREALRVLKEHSIFLVKEIKAKNFLVMINKKTNVEFLQEVEAGNITFDNLIVSREKKEGVFNRVCSSVKKIFSTQATEHFTQATEQFAQIPEQSQILKPSIHNSLNTVQKTSLDIIPSLDIIYTKDYHHLIEDRTLSNSLLEASKNSPENVDDVFVNIKNKEETSEEIRKILREGLNSTVDKSKEAFVQRETQKYLESITKNVPPVPGPQENNNDSDTTAKKVRDLLETVMYFHPQKDKWENINFDEKLIHKFSKAEKTKLAPEHVEICINKMKLKQGLNDPASYLCILLQNPSSSKTGNQIALETQEEKHKKDTLISFYETLTGKTELIDETRIPIFLKKEFYCNVLEKFKVSKEEIAQRVNRAKELFGEEFTNNLLPKILKEAI